MLLITLIVSTGKPLKFLIIKQKMEKKQERHINSATKNRGVIAMFKNTNNTTNQPPVKSTSKSTAYPWKKERTFLNLMFSPFTINGEVHAYNKRVDEFSEKCEKNIPIISETMHQQTEKVIEKMEQETQKSIDRMETYAESDHKRAVPYSVSRH